MKVVGRFGKVLSSRWRPLPFALALGLVGALRGRGIDAAAPTSQAALATALSARGLSCEPGDVVWLDPRGGPLSALTFGSRALVRASQAQDPHDLYVVFTRRSPEGALLEIGAFYNLSRSTGIDEGLPVVSGEVAGYVAHLDGVASAVHALDFRGHRPESYADFTRLQRVQTLVTEWQQTGHPRGVLHDVYALAPPADRVDLSFRGGSLVVVADGKGVRIDPEAREVRDGADRIRATRDERARPAGLVPWAVDRVRAVPAFGDENMQYLKAIAFTALDWGKSAKTGLLGAGNAGPDMASDLAGLSPASPGEAQSFSDPETGWPPPALEPIIKPPLPNEGRWISLDKDPFITDIPGLGSPFVQTFLRSDPQRQGTRVWVTLWDARLVALHMEAGTVEPVSATGEAGPGVIPRTPEVIRNVVAGFNGGFQAQHGEYGMQANGILYLPPKPYAATVLELRDGSTAMGAWPASADVPDEVVSFRQNLTFMVQDDRWNPWGRTWWGGTPPGWHDTIHTTRSGLCLTKEGFFGYFYGVDISAEELGRAMLRARCRHGMHLDMNAGHAGFEFYSMSPAATFQPLGRPLQTDWEYEGQVRDLPDFRFRARRMVRSMGHMNFPRYIRRDERDFFYLTVRRVLPGASLEGAEPREAGEGAWRVRGLPQHGFPYALATTTLRTAEAPRARLRVMALDPRTLEAARPGEGDERTILALASRAARSDGQRAGVRSAGEGQRSVVLEAGLFAITSRPPGERATVLFEGSMLPSPATRAVAGVRDEDGMLLFAELAPEVAASSEALRAADALLAKAGASARVYLAEDVATLLGGSLDLTGQPDPRPHAPITLRLVRRSSPGGRAYFDETPIVDAAVWRPLQMQRVRYFTKPKPRTEGSAATVPSGAPPGSPPTAPSASPPPAPLPGTPPLGLH